MPKQAKQVKTVRDSIDARFLDKIDSELLSIEADSVVGASVIALCTKTVEVLDFCTVDDAGLERDVANKILEQVVYQCHVWYFG